MLVFENHAVNAGLSFGANGGILKLKQTCFCIEFPEILSFFRPANLIPY